MICIIISMDTNDFFIRIQTNTTPTFLLNKNFKISHRATKDRLHLVHLGLRDISITLRCQNSYHALLASNTRQKMENSNGASQRIPTEYIGK